MIWESNYCEACGAELEGESNWHINRGSPGGEVLAATIDLKEEGPFPVCDGCWEEVSNLIASKGKDTAIEQWEPTPPSEK